MRHAPDARGRVAFTATSRSAREAARILVAVVLVTALLETVARLDPVEGRLLTPGFGTPTREVDLQLAGLAHAIRDDGGVDCIVLGSSVVLTGVDPERVSDAYTRLRPHALRTYAFGVPALEADEAAALAQILLEDYHPRLLVYVFTTRDFFGRNALLPRPRLVDAPWFRYRHGDPSLTGWLVEHSAAYRQLLPYRLRLLPDAHDRLGADRRTYRRGFVQFDLVSSSVPPQQPPPFRDLLFPPTKSDLGPLQEMLRHRAPSHTLLLVEMPVRPSILDARWTRERYEVISRVRAMAIAAGATTLTTIGLAVVPADGWNDAVHLNLRGARAFSEWLGEQIARRVPVD